MNALTIRTWASRWNRFQALPAYRKRLIVQTALLILISWASLRLFSLQRILHRLQVLAQQPPRRTPYTMADIQHAVAAVGRALPLATCLINGLSAQYLLSRNGYDPKLHIGVKKEEKTLLTAHAWVTIDGQVVVGLIDDLDSYTPLPGIS